MDKVTVIEENMDGVGYFFVHSENHCKAFSFDKDSCMSQTREQAKQNAIEYAHKLKDEIRKGPVKRIILEL